MAGRGACAAAGVTGADGGAVNSGVVGATGAGFGAGLGPGVGREPWGAGVTGVTGALGALGATGAAGLSATAGLGAGGLGAAGRAACAGEGAPGLGAALRGAPGLALLPPWKASVNLRTTGASIVEDADRTNSPSSWSLAMTALLSTPNSLASSYTRTLATSLLLGPGCGRTVATSWAYSSRAHRVLIAISTYFQLAGVPEPHGVPCDTFYGVSCSTYRRNATTSSAPWTRSARGKARRRTARSRQTRAGCTYAPRPGSVPR